MSDNRQVRQNKYFREVIEIKNSPYDLVYILYGLTDDCTPQEYLGSGSYGRIYGGLLKKRSILKVYKRMFYNKQEIDGLVQRSNTLLFNPSAHTVNIYKVKDKDSRVYIIQQKCDRTLKQQIQSSQSLQKNYDTIKKYIDQIIRGVVHYHRIGIVIGAINLEKIFVLDQNNFKILKISLSTVSKYNSQIINKSLSEVQNEGLAQDMKMLAWVIIKLLWNQQFNLSNQVFKPMSKIGIDQIHTQHLIDLINQCLKGKLNSVQLHNSYKKNIYRIKPEQALKQVQPVEQKKQETPFQKQFSNSTSNFIDAVFEKNNKNKEEQTDKLIEVVKDKKAVLQFLDILKDIISEDQ